MSTIEKLYVYVLCLSLIVLIVFLLFFFTDLKNNISASSFAIIIFLYSLPFILLKKKIKKYNDEMTREINRRSVLIALQTTWIFFVFAIVFFILQDKDYIRKENVELLLFAGVWLIITVRAISTLYFYKKGIEK